MTKQTFFAVNTNHANYGRTLTIGSSRDEALEKAKRYLHGSPSMANIEDVVIMDEDEMFKYTKEQEKKASGKWQQITHIDYKDVYEALPPERLHFDNRFSAFMNPEAQSGSLHTFFVHDKHNNHCYSALWCSDTPYWIIIASLIAHVDH